AHCPVEVVPGISSAIAAPGLVGIPLTDKDLGTHFAVISGQAPDSLDWEILARLDTLIILMGGQTLPQILSHLRHHGKPPETPIAVIKNAGRWQQKVWWGNLTDMVEKTAQVSLSPCVIVIGAVIKRRTMALPLAQKTILVTRAAEQSSQFTALLQAQGAQVLEMPTLVIQAPSSWELLDQALRELETFNWLILTSANGVNFFFER
ncbi:MAG: SAM-dependent methyltransferase, partial [Microcystaceae cyanobacterium]